MYQLLNNCACAQSTSQSVLTILKTFIFIKTWFADFIILTYYFRRSRVQSNVSDSIASLSPNKDSNGNLTLLPNPALTLSPSTSSLAPVSTPLAPPIPKDTDESDFRFVKTKKVNFKINHFCNYFENWCNASGRFLYTYSLDTVCPCFLQSPDIPASYTI